MVVFGDLGVAHSLTLPAIEADVATGAYAAAIHVGDIAYDLPQLRGGRAVQFLKLVEPVSSAVPYMVSPGNHEAAANFSMYKALFSMPGYGPSAPASENLHYSYDVGSVHVVSFNTEVFFWPEDWDESHMQRMYDWMAADLAAAAAEKAAGGAVKWIVVVGHRPHYCAAAEQGSGRCGWEQEASRLGIASTCPHNNPHACRSVAGQGNSKVRQWPIEQLLSRYGVDLVVFGHIHCYERYNAVYNYTVVDTPGPGNVFVNPRAPVHVTVGGAGNVEMRIGPGAPPQGRCASNAPWCAFQSGSGPSAQQGYDFSYGRVSWNVTSMHWQQVSVTFGRVIDEWWIKRSHF